MLQAALRSGAARPALRLRGLRPPPARRAPLRRRRPAPAGCSRPLEEFRFGDDELAGLRRRGVVDEATLRLAGRLPLLRRHLRLRARASATSPARRCSSSRAPSPRRVLLETLVLSILNHDCASPSAAARMATAAGGRPCIEMGSRRTHEEAAVAAARAAYVAGFATHQQPRGRAAATASRRPAPPRTRSRCCTTTSATPSRPRSPPRARARPCSSTPTTCAEAVATRGRGRRAGARRGPARLRRPAACWPARSAPARRARRHRHPDRRHARPRRVRDRRARRRAGRRLRRRHVAGHRLGRTHRGLGLQARRPRRTTAGRWRPVAKKSATRPRRRPQVGAAPARRGRRGGGRGRRHRAAAPRTTATTAR